MTAALQDSGSHNPLVAGFHFRGVLPHLKKEGSTYFVTFRCADALPQEKLIQWREELKQWVATHPEPHDAATRRAFYERFPARLQDWLDAGYGACPSDGKFAST